MAAKQLDSMNDAAAASIKARMAEREAKIKAAEDEAERKRQIEIAKKEEAARRAKAFEDSMIEADLKTRKMLANSRRLCAVTLRLDYR